MTDSVIWLTKDSLVSMINSSKRRNNIFLLNYIPGETPQWQQSDALLNAGGPISAINHGAFASNGDFIATIVNSNVVIFGPTVVSEVGAPAPAGPMITITPVSQTGAAGTTFTYQISETGFLTVPTLAIKCDVPMGTCSISGTNLTVTNTAPSTSTPALVFPSVSAGVRGLMLLTALLIGIVAVQRRNGRLSVALVGIVLMAGCGGKVMGALGPSPGPVVNPGTPAGTYTIIVSAGSQASATVMLTIQ
jgi:hypothetical protein